MVVPRKVTRVFATSSAITPRRDRGKSGCSSPVLSEPRKPRSSPLLAAIKRGFNSSKEDSRNPTTSSSLRKRRVVSAACRARNAPDRRASGCRSRALQHSQGQRLVAQGPRGRDARAIVCRRQPPTLRPERAAGSHRPLSRPCVGRMRTRSRPAPRCQPATPRSGPDARPRWWCCSPPRALMHCISSLPRVRIVRSVTRLT